jgi:hypothetical protein
MTMDAVRQLSPEEIPTALADLQLIAERRATLRISTSSGLS